LYSELSEPERKLLLRYLVSPEVFCLMHNISTRTVTIETSKYPNAVALAMHLEDHVEAGEFHQHRSALEQQPMVSNYLRDRALLKDVAGEQVTTADSLFTGSLDKKPVVAVDIKSDVKTYGAEQRAALGDIKFNNQVLFPFINKLNKYPHYCMDFTRASDTCQIQGKSFDPSIIVGEYRDLGLSNSVNLHSACHGDSEARNHVGSFLFYNHVFKILVESGHKKGTVTGDELFDSIKAFRVLHGSDFRKHTISDPRIDYSSGISEFGKSVKSHYPGSSGLITDGSSSSNIFEPFIDLFK
jgi:hypothetical protein